MAFTRDTNLQHNGNPSSLVGNQKHVLKTTPWEKTKVNKAKKQTTDLQKKSYWILKNLTNRGVPPIKHIQTS